MGTSQRGDPWGLETRLVITPRATWRGRSVHANDKIAPPSDNSSQLRPGFGSTQQQLVLRQVSLGQGCTRASKGEKRQVFSSLGFDEYTNNHAKVVNRILQCSSQWVKQLIGVNCPKLLHKRNVASLYLAIFGQRGRPRNPYFGRHIPHNESESESH